MEEGNGEEMYIMEEEREVEKGRGEGGCGNRRRGKKEERWEEGVEKVDIMEESDKYNL